MLEVRRLRGIDPHVGERAEPSGDPVYDLARPDGILDHPTRGGDALTRADRE